MVRSTSVSFAHNQSAVTSCEVDVFRSNVGSNMFQEKMRADHGTDTLIDHLINQTNHTYTSWRTISWPN